MCEFAAVSTMAPPRCHRHQLLLVVLMLGIMGSSSFSSQEQCPPICACLGNTVDCSNGHLPQIPARLPSWTGILWVTLVLTAVTEQLIASHHIEETDAGVDRPLYLRNKHTAVSGAMEICLVVIQYLFVRPEVILMVFKTVNSISRNYMVWETCGYYPISKIKFP